MKGVEVVEVVKRGKSHKSKQNIKGSVKYGADGKALMPVKQNGSITMKTQKEIQKMLDKKDKRQKAKFIPNDKGGVDVVPVKAEPKKEVTVQMLIDAVKDIEVDVSTDKSGYVNFKLGRSLITYASDTGYGLQYAVRSSEHKSGWKSVRCVTAVDLKYLVEMIKKSVENKTKFASALIPYYLCTECEYKTPSKSEMVEHLSSH